MNQEHLDVVIIGAGLSGIGAAVHLQQQCPGKTFALLEMRAALGGTWDLFRFPGIRSDSDMHTLGYRFKPWAKPKGIAGGADIRRYIEETASEYGIDDKIRYRHKVLGLDWSSRVGRWTLRVERVDTGEIVSISSQFVICCAGYYKYEHGYTPSFAGRDEFRGQVIHPQSWPEDLDYAGKRIVVIGSGATAVTLVPALANTAAHVVMLQRSPSYLLSLPGTDTMAARLRRYLPERAVYSIIRTRNLLISMGIFNFSRRWPERARALLMKQVEKQVGDAVDMKHFSPHYDVWDERLCIVPDGDMFKALRSGRASVVTDQIERFTDKGILLASGQEIEADIIVTATGLELQILGGSELTFDGEPVNIADKLYYKGSMLEDVPNLALVFGYTNASWTLKADLILDYFCRVMNHMERRGVAVCTPRSKGVAADHRPFVDLSAGYIQRALDLLPRQGTKAPWKFYQNYLLDIVLMKLRRLNDSALELSNPVSQAHGRDRAPATGASSARAPARSVA
ncbi:flavin-containing monooxygenase [Haliangium sp.]|uniref:flavin-containing monooxygenase n=1 Tax=Haliangium sp. TaxID=2663208 RepID=UPI003D09CCE2